MNEEQREKCLRRMQNAMRAMTQEEISDMQRRQAQMVMNNQDAMRGGAGMQNFWTTDPNEAHWLPHKPKPTFWQRLMRLFRAA